ncbi:MAG: hypothetical protein ACYS76_10475 [Planctomycetota bacterium]
MRFTSYLPPILFGLKIVVRIILAIHRLSNNLAQAPNPSAFEKNLADSAGMCYIAAVMDLQELGESRGVGRDFLPASNYYADCRVNS